jgi:Tol biopolymer transport system component
MNITTRAFVAAALLAAPLLAQWSAPTQVAALNTTGSEIHPSVTGDGLTMYFASSRSGNWELYQSTRALPFGAFGAPSLVTELNDAVGVDAGPHVSPDGLEIWFDSSRTGGAGGSDLWKATRPNTSVPFSAPVVVTELNSSGAEASPSITEDGLEIWFISSRAGGPGGGSDIWLATRPDRNSPFGTPVPDLVLSTPGAERDATISADGLTVAWCTDRTGGVGSADVWMATRLSRAQPFSNFVNLTPLNSTGSELAASPSYLGDEMFFGSSRPGVGAFDIYSGRFTGLTSNGIAGPGRTMRLRFSDPASSGLSYVAAASLGSVPGIPIDTRTLPLNADGLLFISIGGLPGILNGFIGTLDIDGVANGTVTIPNSPIYLGVQFVVAFVVLDPNAPSNIRTISNAKDILIQ